MLNIDRINVSYGDMKVLHDLSLNVSEGEIVSLVGSNGAGKTTLLRVISGFVPVTSGSIIFENINLLLINSFERAKLGIAHIPQGRGILGKLSVMENLELGAYINRSKDGIESNLSKIYQYFPILETRKKQAAGSLSGGEQQMLAIARALMMNPKLIIMDEPSLGLSPLLVEEVFKIITNISRQGFSILLVEQNLKKTLLISNRAYVIENGWIVNQGKASELLNDPIVQKAYLGV